MISWSTNNLLKIILFFLLIFCIAFKKKIVRGCFRRILKWYKLLNNMCIRLWTVKELNKMYNWFKVRKIRQLMRWYMDVWSYSMIHYCTHALPMIFRKYSMSFWLTLCFCNPETDWNHSRVQTVAKVPKINWNTRKYFTKLWKLWYTISNKSWTFSSKE